MSKPVCSMEDHQQQRKHTTSSFDWSKFSEISLHKQKQTLDKCRLLTNSVYDGLDLRHEILAVNNQNLGHTILLYSNEEKNNKNITNKDDNSNNLAGLAVCHCGAGSILNMFSPYYIKILH